MDDSSYKNLFVVLNRNHPEIKVDNFLKENNYKPRDYHQFLSNLIVEPKYTFTIMTLFKSILPLILSFLIENSSLLNNQMVHDKVTFFLVKIIPYYENTIEFILKHFKNKKPLIDRFLNQKSEEKDLELIKAAYYLLYFYPTEFSKKWNWSAFYKGIESKNLEIKWYSSRCLSILLKHDNNSNFVNDTNELSKLLKETDDNFLRNSKLMSENETPKVTKEIKDNSSMINIFGILLSKKNKITTNPMITYTDTTKDNMKNLAYAVSQGSTILLEGTTGSGKTVLVEELARITGNSDLIKVHLDESFDNKDLLGTYICTDVPGEFKWQPGALVKAVTEGRWILIEDIDLASFDVISSLIPLIESNSLYLISRDETITAPKGFKLFLTQSLVDTFSGVPRRQKSIPILPLCHKIFVKTLPTNEVQQVLEDRFKSFHEIIPKFIETYEHLKGDKSSSVKEEEEVEENKDMVQYKLFGRKFSLRDLIKWCDRVFNIHGHKIKGKYIISEIKDDIFNEARDCFCGMLSKKSVYDLMVQGLATVWEISNERLTYFHDYYKPTIQDNLGNLSIGRITMKRNQEELSMSLSKKMSFAHTKYSLRLLEQISACVEMNEPVLLSGETGTGKTTTVQYLSVLLGNKLVVHNLNQQTDSADFIGGYKPIDLRILANSLKSNFEKLFSVTFSSKSNERFLIQLKEYFNQKNWDLFVALIEKGIEKAKNKLIQIHQDGDERIKNTKSPKKRKNDILLIEYWNNFEEAKDRFARQQNLAKNSFAFSFVEGSLITALKEGHWILLDEINLASTETLERLSGLLEGKDGTLFITEKGDTEPIKRHPNFRLFACMNPPTDIGKKNLPPSLRSRFTEFYVKELEDRDDLKIVVRRYLESVISNPPVEDIVDFFLESKRQALTNLSDGSNQKPQYSLRTLSRALEFTKTCLNTYGIERSLYEGLCMSFLTQLNSNSIPIMENLIKKYVLKKTHTNELNSTPKSPGKQFVQFEHFWIKSGPLELLNSNSFIRTPTVNENLKNLARIIISYKYPILLQGPTSAGKTSMVKYLAERTGHRFVRINNHETTDLQEYFGTYITNSEGKLIFKEGILVEAVRNGYWIVLDELNLAPSDILEGLNRLLDDNRELFIPETQEVIKPHPHFQLFATQNPPGVYGGRKMLSRAFRNRFMELHVDDIPGNELIQILQQRCLIPKSFATCMVNVMKDLQSHRQRSKIFAGKTGFITPRDLFRWAERIKAFDISSKQDIAQIGYMLLAERLRKDDEKEIVKESLEINVLGKPKHKKVSEFKTLDVNSLYEWKSENETKELFELLSSSTSNFTNIVWTQSMKRLFRLVGECIKNKEPVLLVGETGCGKTTIAQLYSFIRNQHLHILNCHQHTETSDFLGSLRPVRARDQLKSKLEQLIKEFFEIAKKMIQNLIFDSSMELEELIEISLNVFNKISKLEKKPKKEFKHLENIIEKIQEFSREYKSLFIWYDGPLVNAMKKGDMFLIDEISLADDAVLERLNSVLEPERQLVLPEKGSESIEEINSNESFLIIATMNPGGDFGKKELSPALRNRFTEIYVPSLSIQDDLGLIIEDKLIKELKTNFKNSILDFLNFFQNIKSKKTITVRDIMSWVEFLNLSVSSLKMNPWEGFIHGAEAVFLDGLGVGIESSEKNRVSLKLSCFEFLINQIPEEFRKEIKESIKIENLKSSKENEDTFGYSPFFITKGTNEVPSNLNYTFNAPTTTNNILKVLRAMQISKPILLEGSPGVGKTTLITALAKASGHTVVRINLSEQTDMMDLLGSDLPVEGSDGGEFEWSDGIFLRALKAGDWILLDELNLASQSVLEGLNSVLDHRSEIFIPELGKTFSCPKKFRIFASQNPLQQGGGRKGLPKSFLNRFTKVYVDELNRNDLLFISLSLHGEIGKENILKMIEFNQEIHKKTMIEHKFGRKGSPWEFNLRDIFRWCEMLKSDYHQFNDQFDSFKPSKYLDCIYRQRMRTEEDRESVIQLFESIFETKYELINFPSYSITSNFIQIGSSQLKKNFENSTTSNSSSFKSKKLLILHSFLNPLENLMKCIQMNYPAIITGPSSCGKNSIVKLLAELSENDLNEFSMSSSTDTVELLGGFEQIDASHKKKFIAKILKEEMFIISRNCSIKNITIHNKKIEEIYNLWSLYDSSINSTLSNNDNPNNHSTTIDSEIQNIILLKNISEKIYSLNKILKFELIYKHEEILKQLEDIENLIKNGAKGRFEWKDGVIIKSMELGNWVLIDNVNFCPPTVLDRLNSLLEPNGVLVVNERGSVDGDVKIVKPHPNFRVFMLMDPKYGEISRAMRNRGIEISMNSIQIPSQDVFTLLSNIGITKKQISEKIINFHLKFLEITKNIIEEDKPILRDILRCGEYFCNESKQRSSIEESLYISLENIYISNRILSKEDSKNAFELLQSICQSDKNIENFEMIFPSNYLLTNSFKPSMPNFRTLFRDSAYMFQFIHSSKSSLNDIKKICNEIPSFSLSNLPKNILQVLEGFFTENHLKDLKFNSFNLEKLLRSMEFSSNYFIEMTTEEDLILRNNWLLTLEKLFKNETSISNIFKKVNWILSKMSTTNLINEIKNHRNKLENLHSIPLDLRMNKSMYEKHQKVLSETNLYQKLSLKIQSLYVSYDQEEYLKKIKNESYVQSKMNLIEQSYYFTLHPNQRKKLTNDKKIIIFFHPLFKELRLMFEKILEPNHHGYSIEEIEKLFSTSNRLWKYCLNESLIKENILIYWKKFIKNLKNVEEFYQLSFIFKEISNELNTLFPNSNTKNYLWKLGGTPIVFSEEERQIQNEILNFNSNEENKELNHLIIKGLSTIYCLSSTNQNISKKEEESFKNYLKELPSILEEKSKITISKKKKEEEDLINEIFEKYSTKKIKIENQIINSHKALLPLHDHKSLIIETNLISKITKLSFELMKEQDFDLIERESLIDSIINISTELIDYTSLHCSRSPVDMVPYQSLIWKLKSNKKERDFKNLNSILQEIWLNWNNRLWNNSFNKFEGGEEEKDNFEGPPKLFEDLKARRIVDLLNEWNKIPMKIRFSKIDQLKQIINFLSIGNEDLPEIEKSDWNHIINTFGITILCFKKSFDSDTFSMILKCLKEIENIEQKDLEQRKYLSIQFKNELSKSNDSRFRDSIQDVIVIFDLILKKGTQYKEDDEINDNMVRGKIWCLLGLYRVNLVLPSLALDPTLKYSIDLNFIKESELIVDEKIEIYTKIENFITGGNSNFQISSLENEKSNFEILKQKIEKKFVKRPFENDSKITFLNLYRDLQQFCNSLTPKEKLKRMTEEIYSKSNKNDTQEELWQLNTEQYLKKIIENYPGFEDLTIPFISCVYQIKYGLRLLSFGSQIRNKSDSIIHKLISVLIEFPTSNDPENIKQIVELTELVVQIDQSNNQSKTEFERYEILLKVLKSLLTKSYLNLLQSGEKLNSKNLKCLDEVFTLYSNIFDFVSTNLEKKRQEEEDLYKYKEHTTEILTDEQLVEKEINDLFPSFDEHFADLETDLDLISDHIEKGGQNKKTNQDIEKVEKILKSNDGIQYLIRIHEKIFNWSKSLKDNKTVKSNSLETSLESIRKDSFLQSFESSKLLMKKSKKPYEFKSSDNLPLLLNASNSLISLKEKIDTNKLPKEYDFYSHENIPEITLSFNVVYQLVLKLNKLLEKYEENPELINLIQISERILSLQVSSPLAKVISGLEMLLKKATEWEQFLTSPVGSIKQEIGNISALIIRWRKMELGNWRTIFITKSQLHASKSYEFWFKFYRLINLTNFEEKESENEKEIEEQIFSICDDFMRSSSFGEFKTRLNILNSLSYQIEVEEKLNFERNQNQDLRTKLKNIIYNIFKFYEQFSDKIDETISLEMKPLEEKLIDFIKLMRWTDTNINGIQNSTQKARKKLAKFSTGYSNILTRRSRDIWDVEQKLELEKKEEPKDESKKKKKKRKKKEQDEYVKSIDLINIFKNVKSRQSKLNQDDKIMTLKFERIIENLFKMKENDSNFNHEKCEKTLNSMKNVSEKFILNDDSIQFIDTTVNYLEDLSTTIIERMEELKKSDKISLKQRALGDLLGELKNLGISNLLKPLKNYTEIQKVMEQNMIGPLEFDNLEVNNYWKKSDEYYFKNILLLQKLRNSYQDFHKNIQKEALRMLGFAENVFFMSMKQRNIVNTLSNQLKELKENLKNLNFQTKSKIEIVDSKVKEIGLIPPQNFMKSWIEKQSSHLIELLESLEELNLLQSTVLSTGIVKSNSNLNKIIQSLKSSKKLLLSIDHLRKNYVFVKRDFDILFNNFNSILNLNQEINSFLKTSGVPNSSVKVHSLIQKSEKLSKEFKNDLLSIEQNDSKQSGDIVNHDEFVNKFKEIYDQIIFRTKITIQNIKEKKSILDSSNEEEEEQQQQEEGKLGAFKLQKYFEETSKSLKLDDLNELISKLISLIVDFSNEDIYSNSRKLVLDNCSLLISNLSNLISYLYSTISIHSTSYICYQKSISKFEYILLNTFSTLFKEGFCVQEETNEEGGEGEMEFVEGTGMDEGDGVEDVSKEIQNEEQLLNQDDLQKPEQSKDLSNNDDEGVEMENDFEAELYDDEENKDEKDEEEDEEGDELDDEMGEVDNEDDEVLDKKLWDDEKNNDREEKSDQKDNKNAPQEESEIKAKDDEDDEDDQDDQDGDGKEKKQKKDKPKEEREDSEEEIEEIEQEDFTDKFQGEQMEGQEEKEQMEEHFDLPEELELEMDEDDEIDEEGEEEEEKQEDEAAIDPAALNLEQEPSENIDTEEINQDPENKEDDQNEEGESENSDNENEQDENENSGGRDQMIEDNEPEDEEEEEGEDEEKEREHRDDVETAFEEDLKQTPFGVKETAGKASEIMNDADDEKSEEKQMNPDQESGKDVNKEQFGDSYEQGNEENKSNETPKSNQSKFDPNPFRNLGDALKEWKKQVNIKESNEKEEQEEEKMNQKDENAEEYEYDKNENNEEDFQQALGLATEQQSEEFPKLNKEEEEEEDENMQEVSEDKNDKFENEKEKNEKNLSNKMMNKNEMNEENQEDAMDIEEENFQTKEEEKKEIVKKTFENTMFSKREIEDAEEMKIIEDNENIELKIEDLQKMREELDEMLNQWRSSKEKVEHAKEMWNKFDQVTNSLSQELCEQLRLILEPTLATKMKGDYKTGKRINMKKIIPYIASQFRRDKIWLRRTKPNKRQYHVLVAVDDSKSMSKNNAGNMACEAVVLLCKAMSQLEVGQLGVLKFGENVQLLHPFDRPFTDDAGSEIIAQFTFDQKQTQMAEFLKYSTQMMDIYKSFSSFRQNIEEVQLTFIISDGRLLEREEIVKLVREANEKRQLIVFILIDSQNTQDSVLELKTITYPNNKLTIQSYIDQFPFPYYIILRNIQTLPEILADALRQWFELMQTIQE
eukprot:gene7221-11536_t